MGLRHSSYLYYIKSGKLDVKYGKLYSNLFLWRRENDYSDFVDFDEETVSPLIEQVQEFNQIISKLIKK